jgi:hypothetical protein
MHTKLDVAKREPANLQTGVGFSHANKSAGGGCTQTLSSEWILLEASVAVAPSATTVPRCIT